MANNLKPLHEARTYTDRKNADVLDQFRPITQALGDITTVHIIKDPIPFELGEIYPYTGQDYGNETNVARSGIFTYEAGDFIQFAPNNRNGWLYAVFYFHEDNSFSHTPQNDFLGLTANGGTVPLLEGYTKARLMVSEYTNTLEDHSVSDLSQAVTLHGSTSRTMRPSHIEKSVIVLGDNVTDRTYENSTKGEWVNEMLNRQSFKFFKEYAVWGATWLHHATTAESLVYDPSDGVNNVLWNQYNRLKADITNGMAEPPDAIVLYAGSNDAINYPSQIGTVEDAFGLTDITGMAVTDITTTCRAIRYLCELIREDYPTCHLLLVTPYMVPDSTANTNLLAMRGTIIACCETLGIDCIDATYRSGMTRHARYYEDGSYPSAVGAQVLGRFLANEISTRLHF